MVECSGDKKLLPVKAHYFLLNGAHAGVIPFIPVYAQQLGISSGAIGIILAVLSCLTVVTKTAFGGIADRFHNLKQILLILILIDVGADVCLNFIPRPYQAPVNSTLVCHGSNSYLPGPRCTQQQNDTNRCRTLCSLCQTQSAFCLDKFNSTSVLSSGKGADARSELSPIFECLYGNDTTCTDSCFDGSATCEDITGTNPPLQLWLLGLFASLVFISNGSIVSLSDAACYQALGDRHQLFGRQRMWGTLGWGLFALITGYLNQLFTGSAKLYSYSAGFYMLVVLFAIDLFVIRGLYLKDTTMSKTICIDVGKLFSKPKIIVFIVGMYGIGIVTGVSRSYLFWYLRTTLSASQLVLGCVSAMQCFLGELPFFFFSGWIIQKLGHVNTFTMSFIAYGFKFLSHSFLTNPWWALLIELLQGPCFGSFYSAMTSYSKKISPEGAEATMQGVVSGTFEGLGVATGSLLVGFCMSNFGGRTTFYWTGLVSLAAGVIHWVVNMLLDWKATEKTGMPGIPHAPLGRNCE